MSLCFSDLKISLRVSPFRPVSKVGSNFFLISGLDPRLCIYWSAKFDRKMDSGSEGEFGSDPDSDSNNHLNIQKPDNEDFAERERIKQTKNSQNPGANAASTATTKAELSGNVEESPRFVVCGDIYLLVAGRQTERVRHINLSIVRKPRSSNRNPGGREGDEKPEKEPAES